MSNPVRIASNPVRARLFDASKEVLLEAHRLLSYRVDGAEHMQAFQSGGWNGRSSFFDYDTQSFPAGFVHHMSKGLRAAGVAIQLVRKPLPPALGPECPKVDAFAPDPRYDYQDQTVDQLVRHGQITAKVATGGGKSRIARLAMMRIGRRTLFLTTRAILMHQMHAALTEMTGEPVAILGDGDWGIEYTPEGGGAARRKISQFSVGMVQTLASRIALPDPTTGTEARAQQQDRRDKTLKVLEMFELLVLEEAHEAAGNGYFEVANACKNAAYRLSLTATPFMKLDEEANMRLLACGGPVAITISEKQLIDSGILARPYFKFIRLSEAAKPKKLYKSTPWQAAYKIGIVQNENRNKLIVVEVARAVRYGLSAMILVKQQAHGYVLKEMLETLGLRADYIYGENDKGERDAALKRLRAGAIDVLIGSTILDVGVDVPAVGMIVLAGGGKDETGLRQRIGRGLREKKNGMPNVALVVDVQDDFNNHLRGHFKERRAIIEGTPGFAEGIVAEFDYAALGLTRRVA